MSETHLSPGEADVPVSSEESHAAPSVAAPAEPDAPSPAPTFPDVAAPIAEAPARGIRVATLIWAGIVAIGGIMMILIPTLGVLQFPALFISLIALLGLVLIAAAIVSAVRKH